MSIKRGGIIISINALASMALVGVAFAAPEVFERNLYFGLYGDADVVQLQEFLTREGFYGGPINGNFYALTRDGVIKYQRANRIEPAAGFFGPITRAAANIKISKQPAAAHPPSTSQSKSAQIQWLQSQIDSLLKQLAALQSPAPTTATTTPVLSTAQPATTTTTVPEIVATSTSETATPTPALPSSFDSTLRIASTYADYTMTRFSAVVLGEFMFSADEKIAITKLRFKNIGTLEDDSILGLRLIHSKTSAVIAAANLKDSAATFAMVPDLTKTDKGIVASGETYTLLADNILASTYGIRKTVEYDIESESDILAFDYNNLSRIAKLKQVVFPIKGPYIKTY